MNHLTENDNLSVMGKWTEFNRKRVALTGDAEPYYLRDVNLDKSCITAQSLDYLVFEVCGLRKAVVSGCYGNPVFFIDCDLISARFETFVGRPFFLRCNLTGVRFSELSETAIATFAPSAFWDCTVDAGTRRHLISAGFREDNSRIVGPGFESQIVRSTGNGGG